MNIAFVHCPMPYKTADLRRTYWTHFDARYYATHPRARLMQGDFWELPHWVTWLGGVLNHEGFTSLDVINLFAYSSGDCMKEVEIQSALVARPADVYLFSPITINLPNAYRVADMVKSLTPRSTVVFGGVTATPLREQVAAHPSVDYVIYDRGEYALPALLRALQSQITPQDVGNVVYQDAGGQIVTNSKVYPDMPVEQIPFPKVDLFPSTTGSDLRYIRQNYALGCPYTCHFCSIPTIGREPAYFPIDRVLSEIRAYKARFGAHHHVYFGDETFTLNPKRTLELCAALEAEGDIEYDCQTRSNCLKDRRMLTALYDSGCRWIEVGVETVNEEALKLSNKRCTTNGLEETLAHVRDAGLPTCAFVVVGFPNETLAAMRRTVDFVASLLERKLLHASYLYVLVPYPGTPMYHHPDRYGMTLRHHRYDLYGEDLEPVFDGTGATAEQVYEVYQEGVGMFSEAMKAPPYLGEVPDSFHDERTLYGKRPVYRAF